MKVGFVTRGGESVGSARVRVLQYLPLLGAQGIHTRVVEWSPTTRLRQGRLALQIMRLAGWADVIILQKPRLHPLLLEALHRFGKAVIVDFDDAVWVSGHGRPSAEFGRRLLYASTRAHGTVAGSSWLAEWVRSRGARDVRVIPSAVDTDRLQPVSSARPSHSVVRLGWIGSGGNLVDFTPEIREALQIVVRDGAAEVVIVSSRPLEIAGFPARFVKWNLEGEQQALQAFDIGLMPLADTERSRGRCGFKAVQYMAVGLPVVASPVGGAADPIEGGKTGLLASTADEWVESLNTLIHQPELRATLGAAGRARAVAHYSVKSCVTSWIDLLRKVEPNA